MKKVVKYVLFALLLGGVYFAYENYLKLDLIDGFSAKNITSCVFLAHRSQELTETEDNNVPSMSLAFNEVNGEEKSVTSTVYGLKKRKAVYTEGLGALLLPQNKNTRGFQEVPNRNFTTQNLPYPYGDLPQKDTTFADINYPDLQKGILNAFAKSKKTRSVLVLYDGYVIAEKYADGFDENSIMMGWSMTKSVTATIFGVLQKQGKLSIDDNHLFPEWEGDDRKNITLRNLLNMNSGLEWEERYDHISDATKMLFKAEDMSRAQLVKKLTKKTNESWSYSSGTTNLLSGFLRKKFDSRQAYFDFWYRELIDKIGMHSMVIETDYVGNFVGSSYGWATTRDWAKLGQLYLNQGNWNGEQIIDTSWVNFVKKPTNTSNGRYGGHFWLNAGGFFPDVPRDLYACDGFMGQYVFVIPSKKLVIVRTGLSTKEEFDRNDFLKEIIDAVK